MVFKVPQDLAITLEFCNLLKLPMKSFKLCINLKGYVEEKEGYLYQKALQVSNYCAVEKLSIFICCIGASLSMSI